MSLNFNNIQPKRDHYIIQYDFLYIVGPSGLSKP